MAAKKTSNPTSVTTKVTVPAGPVSLVAIQRSALLAKRDEIPLTVASLNYDVSAADNTRSDNGTKVRDYTVKISWAPDTGENPVDVDAVATALQVPTVGDLNAATDTPAK